MSDALNALKKVLGYATPVIHALQLIQSITGTGGTDASAALKAVGAIVNTVNDGITNGVDPADIMKELDKLMVGIATNDAKADKDLAAKFPGGV